MSRYQGPLCESQADLAGSDATPRLTISNAVRSSLQEGVKDLYARYVLSDNKSTEGIPGYLLYASRIGAPEELITLIRGRLCIAGIQEAVRLTHLDSDPEWESDP